MKVSGSFVALALSFAASFVDAAPSRHSSGLARRNEQPAARPSEKANPNAGAQNKGKEVADKGKQGNANKGNNANNKGNNANNKAGQGNNRGNNQGNNRGNNANNNNKAVGAAYFLTNDETGNMIIASEFGEDGKLFAATAIPAGGRGSHSLADGPDALLSQGAVKVSGNNLFAVNAGSNTISMFEIDENQPSKLTRVGDPVSAQGEFPVSLAVSPVNDAVCVLNGGELNSVACFKPDSQLGLLALPNTFREIGLDQSTAPSGPEGSASHILFNNDGNRLIASIKGVGNDAGFLAIFDVAQDGSLSEQFQAITPPEGGVLPFGMSNHPTNPDVVVVTDAKIGFDVIDITATIGDAKNEAASINPNLEITKQNINKRQASKNENIQSLTAIQSLAAVNTVAKGDSSANAIDGQQAVCWSAFSKKTGTFFLSDIGTSIISEISVDGKTLEAKLVQQYSLGNGIATIDEDIATINNQDFLYVLAANQTSIEVVALPGAGKGQHIQSFRLQAGMQKAGVSVKADNLQGMATFVRK